MTKKNQTEKKFKPLSNPKLKKKSTVQHSQ